VAIGLPSVTAPAPSASTGNSPWPYIINAGLDITRLILQSRAQNQQANMVAGLVPTSGQVLGMGAALPAANRAAVLAAIAQAGGRIVGNVVRIARAAWAALPDWVKVALPTLGLSLLFTDGDSDGEKKKPKRRGISAAQLKGFHAVVGLLRKVGMRPKKLGYGGSRRCKR
jgi:hypothetical protein